MRLQPHGVPRKARSVEIARLADLLIIEDGSLAVRRWPRRQHMAHDSDFRALLHGFTRNTTSQISLRRDIETENTGQRWVDVGVAYRRGIGKTGFEIRSDRCHEIPRIGAAERAVHSLAGFQRRVGDFRSTHQKRHAAIDGMGCKAHDERRLRREGGAFQVYRAHGQRAGNLSKSIVREYAADVVFTRKNVGNFRRERFGIWTWKIDMIRAAIGNDNHVRIGRIVTQCSRSEGGQVAGFVIDRRILVEWVKHRQTQTVSKIDGHKSGRCFSGRNLCKSDF